jgi:hypothetical protein
MAVYLVSWYIALSSPLSLEYEGASLWAATELAKGHNIYSAEHLVQPPWVVTVYPPLYFLLGAPFQIGDFNYPALRLISILAFGFTMLFFYRLIRLFSTSKLNVAVGLVLFASYVSIWSGSFKARADMLALALSIGSLYFFFREFIKTKPLDADADTLANATVPKGFLFLLMIYAPSILMIVAAVYSKVSSIVILPAVCYYLATQKRFKDMFVYGGCSLTLCAILYLILDAVTAGGFTKHQLFSFDAPYSTADLQKHLNMFGVDWPKLFIIPVIGLVWLENNEKRERLILPATLAVVSGLLTAYTIGSMHATLNHGLMFYFAISWLTVIFIEIFPLSLGASMVFASALCTYILSTLLQPMMTLSARMDRARTDVISQNTKGKVILVEDPALALACGAQPLYVDIGTFLQTLDRAERSLAEVQKALALKQYPAVVININDSLHDKPMMYWQDSFMQTLEQHYKKYGFVVGNGDLQQMYVPK